MSYKEKLIKFVEPAVEGWLTVLMKSVKVFNVDKQFMRDRPELIEEIKGDCKLGITNSITSKSTGIPTIILWWILPYVLDYVIDKIFKEYFDENK